MGLIVIKLSIKRLQAAWLLTSLLTAAERAPRGGLFGSGGAGYSGCDVVGPTFNFDWAACAPFHGIRFRVIVAPVDDLLEVFNTLFWGGYAICVPCISADVHFFGRA
jgi:hypothetical protein